MKIVHLVTSPIGGAAIAARRLNDALKTIGCESTVLSVQRRTSEHIEDFQQQEISLERKILSSAITLVQRKVIQKGPGAVSVFSLDLLNWQDPGIADADVLHLHAFYNLVTIKSFLRHYPEKRKVITLHDERFYTGGCHYCLGCQFLFSGCNNCPQVQKLFRGKVRQERASTLTEIEMAPDLTIICPSNWIQERAMRAIPVLKPAQFKRIMNPIPSSRVIDLQPTYSDLVTFGFIAQNLENPIKNLNLLLRAFIRISKTRPNQYKLILVGKSSVDHSVDSQSVSQVEVKSSKEMADVFSKMDVLVVPSTEDNLPNVLGEALMNGVSIIGSDVGGIPEVLRLFDQTIFESENEDELVQALLAFEKKDKHSLRSRAEKIFGYEAVANLMISAYKED